MGDVAARWMVLNALRDKVDYGATAAAVMEFGFIDGLGPRTSETGVIMLHFVRGTRISTRSVSLIGVTAVLVWSGRTSLGSRAWDRRIPEYVDGPAGVVESLPRR